MIPDSNATPPTSSGAPLARWMRLEGSRFASRTLLLHSKAAVVDNETLESVADTVSSWRRRTRRAPVAMKFCKQLINEVDSSV